MMCNEMLIENEMYSIFCYSRYGLSVTGIIMEDNKYFN